jgi:DNA (cytosine-5)-methyltransferase 1
MKTLNVGSDFSGVGAFEEALNRLGIAHDTIFACDIDKYARETYLANHGKPNYFPHDVYEREIPKEPLDIYMTSPPCQAFSIAGKRKGEQDKRGVLFYNSHEFIIKNRPRYFIFENVKGLLSDDGGKTFQRWIDYLAKSVNGNPMIFPHEESAGYHVYYQVLNSKDYGVPQNRERIFIIGVRDDCDATFLFPKKEPLRLRLKDMLEDNPHSKYLINESKKKYLINNQSKRSLPFTDVNNKKIANCILSTYYKQSTDMEYIKVDEKYYLSPKAIKGLFNSNYNLTKDRLHTGDEIIGALCSRDYKDPRKFMDVAPKSDDTDEPKAKVCDQAVINPPTLIAGDGCTTQSSANFVVQLNPSTESGGKQPYQQNRVYDTEGVSPAIVSGLGGERMHNILDNDDKELNENQQTKLDKLTVNDEVSGTLTEAIGRGGSSHEYLSMLKKNQQITGSIRRLTPRECFRLQDFPDTFVLPCSDTQSYKQAGNSITVGVLAAIISKIKFT